MDAVTIELLADHLALSRAVGQWHWDEWGEEDPGGSAESWSESLARRAGRGGVPTVWLAFHENAPIGSVALEEHDMDTRQDCAPWLAGLYVLPAFRGRGVGARLVENCERAAYELGCRRLFLHTVIPDFYLGRG